MSQAPRPPSRVPTLTEIVEIPAPQPVAPVSAAAEPTAPATEPGAPDFVERRRADRRVGWTPASEDALVQRVLGDVQRQIDLMLEVKMREVLAPMLARTTDALVREARTELASTLREVVARAVAQELARHRQG